MDLNICVSYAPFNVEVEVYFIFSCSIDEFVIDLIGSDSDPNLLVSKLLHYYYSLIRFDSVSVSSIFAFIVYKFWSLVILLNAVIKGPWV